MAVQWLRLYAPNAGGTDLIPGQKTKIPHAMQCNQKKEKGEKRKQQKKGDKGSCNTSNM